MSEVTRAASELDVVMVSKTTEDGIWSLHLCCEVVSLVFEAHIVDDLLEVSEEAGGGCQRAVRAAAPADSPADFEVVPLVSCPLMC